MFAHLVVFIGIDYFDQSIFAWFALLAMISMIVSEVKQREPQQTMELSAPQLTEFAIT